LKKELDRTQLEPFDEPQDFDKTMPEFLTDVQKEQMRRRSKLYFETLWKAMGRK
jgi:hypothetical protein